MEADLYGKAKHLVVTPYDLLGYLVPGGFFVTCLAGYEGLLRQNASNIQHTPVHGAVSYLLRAGPRDSWATETVALATFIAVIYVAGHVVASLSAMLVDRVYMAKAHGYPFQRALGVEREESDSTNYYRAAFLCLNAYLLFRFLGLPSGLELGASLPTPFSTIVPAVLTRDNFRILADFLGWAFWILLVVRLLLSATHTTHYGIGEWFAETTAGKVAVQLLQFVLAGFARPAMFITHLVGSPLHARRAMDTATCDAFRARVGQIVGFGNKTSGDMAAFLSSTSAYWACMMHVRSASPALEASADNWLRLYSFARNLSTAFYLAFVYCLVSWANLGADTSFVSEGAKTTLYSVVLALFVGSFVLLLRYYYLYAGYYTKFLIRAVVYLERPGTKAPPKVP